MRQIKKAADEQLSKVKKIRVGVVGEVPVLHGSFYMQRRLAARVCSVVRIVRLRLSMWLNALDHSDASRR